MAEKPLRAEEQDDHDHDKPQDLGDIPQKCVAKTLHETQEEPPGNSPGDTTQSADDYHDQSLEHGMHPQEGVNEK